MIVLTRQDVLVHQREVSWAELYQVEQDLLLCLAMRAIFSDRFLVKEVAMRGGTVLHKVHLAPAARYSEDIDLVAVGESPEEHIRKALMRVLRPILGKERSSIWTALKLAVRNAAKPSRILRCVYEVPSVSEPGRFLRVEVEANVTERRPKYELQWLPFVFGFRGEAVSITLASFNIDEMLATKMRAMFQRKKGRDLFDLYWALTAPAAQPLDLERVLVAFSHYMGAEGTYVPRSEFIAHLDECLADRAGFCTDMTDLLRVGVAYDPLKAGAYLKTELLARLPG